MNAIEAVIAARKAQTAPMRQEWRKPLLSLHIALLKARKASGLTQDEVATKLAVSRRNFQRWEDSTAEPSATELFRWASLLGIAITFEATESANSGASGGAQ